mmetsp:Transcript_8353/g.21026  ORF Transcript_8353/g.21026 Transcript_8353/m.21026 type:complete len:221 (+) Transcript_8353:94-756(+)
MTASQRTWWTCVQLSTGVTSVLTPLTASHPRIPQTQISHPGSQMTRCKMPKQTLRTCRACASTSPGATAALTRVTARRQWAPLQQSIWRIQTWCCAIGRRLTAMTMVMMAMMTVMMPMTWAQPSAGEIAAPTPLATSHRKIAWTQTSGLGSIVTRHSMVKRAMRICHACASTSPGATIVLTRFTARQGARWIRTSCCVVGCRLTMMKMLMMMVMMLETWA